MYSPVHSFVQLATKLFSTTWNLPKSSGPIVGILKGFAGLSGAILTQIYAMINAPKETTLILMVAVGPSMVVIALMFIFDRTGQLVQPMEKRGGVEDCTMARQCLTPEAANALDEAVGVARRRGHAQTTSLHAVLALLSLSSSPLREACVPARNAAHSPRLQFKALDLCLSVSLDRVPSSQQVGHEPPVSNPLMAAIKRSQANQRRQPKNFHLYRDISQQNLSNISCIKVEASFWSSEIKLAIIRPLPNLLRYPRPRGPPVFLCNLENSNPDNDRGPRRSFSFPFPSFAAFFDGEENCRRIGEVLARRRNPLLVGICARDTLTSFIDSVEKKKDGILAKEISGSNVIGIDSDVSRFINGDVSIRLKTRSLLRWTFFQHQKGKNELRSCKQNFFQATTKEAVRGKKKRGTLREEDFTLLQALGKADFWLMFISLVLAAGFHLTVINNMGKDYSTSKMPSMVIMAIGFLYYAIGRPGQIYVLTLFVGLGYGGHWAIVRHLN
ncbi:hypothetical protein SLEP1_g49656 [Rubroshorea leprosula]|uniref:Clp R domain-containing protein n=1 Tax=Rubroshorea leprosula TaxID=152421 RepID=A0AAV5LYT6_9ROSI|nr:hypothetical protein SLEP1_g49656 [Rubroshorea leprosula]